MPGPLSGYKVLSFCRALSGPFTTMLLCDLGAEVIKIEDPKGGDRTRFVTPQINDVSTYFLSVNRGKKSITLNLKDERAKKIVFDLVTKVDVLVENFRPGVMARLGFDYETIRKHNPKIIYTSISGFGQTGPYAKKPAYDMLAQGMGGIVSITGPEDPKAPPVRVGASIGDTTASFFGAMSTLAALLEREKTGEGQMIDVAMLDSQVALCENAIARYFATGAIPRPAGSRHPLVAPFQIFPTKDDYLVVIASNDDLWKNFCTAADKPEWVSDARYGNREGRLAHHAQLEKDMNTVMRSKTSAQWTKLFEAHKVMCGPVNNIEQVTKDPQVNARNMFYEVDHPKAGKHKLVGTPMKFSRTTCETKKAAPELGADNQEVLSSVLGLSEEEIETLRKEKVI
jgi:CoA:oxalate CoA-transferase